MQFDIAEKRKALNGARMRLEAEVSGWLEIRDSYNLEGAQIPEIRLAPFAPVPGTWAGALTDGSGISLWKVAPGTIFMIDGEPDHHEDTKELFFLLEGAGVWVLDGVAHPVETPDVTVALPGVEHHFEAGDVWCWIACKQIPPDAFEAHPGQIGG